MFYRINPYLSAIKKSLVILKFLLIFSFFFFIFIFEHSTSKIKNSKVQQIYYVYYDDVFFLILSASVWLFRFFTLRFNAEYEKAISFLQLLDIIIPFLLWIKIKRNAFYLNIVKANCLQIIWTIEWHNIQEKQFKKRNLKKSFV